MMIDRRQFRERLGQLPGRMLIGLSGGADSVALLCMLCDLRAQMGWTLHAVHVHHGMRAASDEEEGFVRALCEAKAIPLRVFHLTPPANAGEAWAREARYACFREASADLNLAPLVLAHHREDQAETVLLHLMRGAGLTGLTGMRRVTDMDGLQLIRPLLGFSREELREYLREIGQDWREDESNSGDAYFRNRVRHQLLPLMEQLHPGSVAHIARTAEHLQADEEALNGLAHESLPRAGEGYINRAALQSLPASLQKRCLRLLWEREAANRMAERSLSHEQTEGLVGLLNAPAGTRCNLPGNWHGYAGWQAIHLLPPNTARMPLPVLIETRMGEWSLADITLSISCSEGNYGNGKSAQELPVASLKGCTLRTREAKDFIQPFGMNGRKSLQDYFTDRHIDAPFRDRVPLLCRGHEVLMAGGVGVGNLPRYRLDADNVRLTWSGPMPWLDR